MVSPTLKYGDEIIETNTTITHSADETVSCELYNAGPPIPDSLALAIMQEDGASSVLSTGDYIRNDVTCDFSYPEPLQYNVIDLT